MTWGIYGRNFANQDRESIIEQSFELNAVMALTIDSSGRRNC
jgi:hypothetical protein